MVILVTGASGQLGQAIQHIASDYIGFEFVFASSKDLDITKKEQIDSFFENNRIDFCINAAAYTAVDKAETEIEMAKAVNVLGSKNLATACKNKSIKLIHISTDFVFDGTSNIPYLESNTTNPIGVYGQTKLDGEIAIAENMNDYFIVRTSWVYSQFGNNFMKTMLRLASERDSLNIVNDQLGTPTNAIDLAKAIIAIIEYKTKNPTAENLFGIYNFSNEGVASWYDFAKEIFRANNVSIVLNPILSEAFPTPAKRPKYSVLNKSKIKKTFNIKIKSWQEALVQSL